MKFSKIFAGFSSVVMAAAMTISAAAESTFKIENGPTDPWVSAFGSFKAVSEDGKESTSDDYIDAKTFTKDQPIKVDVKVEWSKVTKDAIGYIVIGPAYSNGWEKFGAKPENIEVDFPKAGKLEGDDAKKWTVKGEGLVDKDGKSPDIFLKKDGFIQINDTELDHFSFTLPKEVVNAMIEKANEPDSWDGIIFQIGGGFKVTEITVDQDNVKLASENQPTPSSSSADSTADSNAESTANSTSAADESAGATSSASESKAETTTSLASEPAEEESSSNTGLIIGIAAAVVVVIGIVIFAVKKKDD